MAAGIAPRLDIQDSLPRRHLLEPHAHAIVVQVTARDEQMAAHGQLEVRSPLVPPRRNGEGVARDRETDVHLERQRAHRPRQQVDRRPLQLDPDEYLMARSIGGRVPHHIDAQLVSRANRNADRDRQLQVPRLARDRDEALGDRIDELPAREVHDLEVVNPTERELPPLRVLEPQREAAQPRVAGPREPADGIVAVHHPGMAVMLTVFGRLCREGSGAHDDRMPRRIEGDLLSCTTAEQGAGNQDRYRQAADHRVAPGGGTRPAYRSRVKPMSRMDLVTSAATSRSYSVACCSCLRRSCQSLRRDRTSRPDTPWCSRTRRTARPRATSRARRPASSRASPSPLLLYTTRPRPRAGRRCRPSAGRPRAPWPPARAGTARPGTRRSA